MTDKERDFVVSDRRKFTAEGDLRPDTTPEPEKPQESAPAPPAPAAAEPAPPEMPPAPSAEAQKAGADAYAKSRGQFGPSPLEGRPPQDYEVSFEKLVSQLYMATAVQLGGVEQEGGRVAVDIIGARHTIDTLAMLAEKTKGNLTAAEEALLQNCLFDLRMAFVQVSNLIATQAQAGPPPEKK